MNKRQLNNRGFSLIELMVAGVIFTLITGIVFTALIMTQQRSKMESEVLNSFNGANVAIDQMTRDIHQTGYPPANTYASAAAAYVAANPVVALPFSWSAGLGYPNLPACTMGTGGSCTPDPGSYDIIVETVPDPTVSTAVQWIRYQLPAGSHTLLRAMVPKAIGADPVASTAGSLAPYLDGVMNNASAAEIANIQKYYPNMFPGGVDPPIFAYYCTSSTGPQLCTTANTAMDIQEVQITLIVEASAVDPQTRQPRIVTLTGQAARLNPNQ
jgi:prepilin-type N-terminal cleavage/methylation domain-containing protein